MTTSTDIASAFDELEREVVEFGRVDRAIVSEVQDVGGRLTVSASLYRTCDVVDGYCWTFDTRADADDFRQGALEIVERST